MLVQKRIIFSLKLAGFILLFFVIPGVVYTQTVAQSNEPGVSGLTVSPVVFELSADPGDKVTNQMKVFNPTDSPIEVTMGVNDFTPVGEEGEVRLQEPGENKTFSIATWTKVSPEKFTIQPKKQQIVDFTISPPKDAEPGGHYGSIVATIGASTPSEVPGSSISTKSGGLVLLRVSGQVKEELQIARFKAVKDFQQTGPVDFDILFTNTGSVHVRPAGFITVTDMFGRKVSETEIEQKNVIPGASRKVTANLPKKGLFGRYTATLVVNYGNGSKQTISSVTSFTVLPLVKIGIGFGVVAFIVLLLFIARKRILLAMKVLFGKQ
jgi:Bacterial protein of unknown function (DUF916)